MGFVNILVDYNAALVAGRGVPSSGEGFLQNFARHCCRIFKGESAVNARVFAIFLRTRESLERKKVPV